MKMCSIFAIECLLIVFFITRLSDALLQFDRIPEIVASSSKDHFQRIRPILLHSINGREIHHTRESNGYHTDSVTLQFDYKDGRITVDLQLSVDLLPDGHFLSYESLDDGLPVVINNFTRLTVDHCHYTGTIRGHPKSRAAITTCNGLSGILLDGPDVYYIEKGDRSLNSTPEERFLYKHSDWVDLENHESSKVTISNQTVEIDDETQHLRSQLKRLQRSRSDVTAFRDPYNSNMKSSYVELVLVVDNANFKHFKSVGKVHEFCKAYVNIINALYMPLNVFVALTGVVIWTKRDFFRISTDANKTLFSFASYRDKELLLKHPNDNAQLLTRQRFDNGIVGKAFGNMMCSNEKSVGIVFVYNESINKVAATAAHEMGHSLGMDHDILDCRCNLKHGCIMSAYTIKQELYRWSECSTKQLARALSKGSNFCLKNKPTSLFQSPTCGNGFVEDGEQCDCGPKQFCDNLCCDAATCKLRPNAVCATGDCCDTNTCSLRPAGSLCRSAEVECDLPEYCTGKSEFCPEDVFRQNTIECNGGKAYCYQGQCRSHDDQCRSLWGSSGISFDACYIKNINGSQTGNCGYTKLSRSYTKCKLKNTKCGLLQCLNSNFGDKLTSVAGLYSTHKTYVRVNRSYRDCYSMFNPQSLEPESVPNGAKCGEDKMCLNYRCMSLMSLRRSGIGLDCPKNCSSHGTCDNKGKCHCDIGFVPPFCEKIPDKNHGLNCPKSCSFHGTCDNKGECHCDEGFVAPFCDKIPEKNHDLDCPKNCTFHGTCDNNGACHCDEGFVPPFCEIPTNLNNNMGSVVEIGMYSVFFGVVPFVILCMAVNYLWRNYRLKLPCASPKESLVFKNTSLTKTPTETIKQTERLFKN